jgi:vacuolar-type H+-ATPase subunit E/Vma4
VETMDKHRRYDNTLEARLSRQKSALRSSVYQLLMGESQ